MIGAPRISQPLVCEQRGYGLSWRRVQVDGTLETLGRGGYLRTELVPAWAGLQPLKPPNAGRSGCPAVVLAPLGLQSLTANTSEPEVHTAAALDLRDNVDVRALLRRVEDVSAAPLLLGCCFRAPTACCPGFRWGGRSRISWDHSCSKHRSGRSGPRLTQSTPSSEPITGVRGTLA